LKLERKFLDDRMGYAPISEEEERETVHVDPKLLAPTEPEAGGPELEEDENGQVSGERRKIAGWWEGAREYDEVESDEDSEPESLQFSDVEEDNEMNEIYETAKTLEFGKLLFSSVRIRANLSRLAKQAIGVIPWSTLLENTLDGGSETKKMRSSPASTSEAKGKINRNDLSRNIDLDLTELSPKPPLLLVLPLNRNDTKLLRDQLLLPRVITRHQSENRSFQKLRLSSNPSFREFQSTKTKILERRRSTYGQNYIYQSSARREKRTIYLQTRLISWSKIPKRRKRRC